MVKNRRSTASLRRVADAPDIPDRALQSALEFAVGIAAVTAKQRLPVPFPPELKPFLKFQKLPPASLAAVRAALEGDGEFLRRLGMVATDELVDPVGMLWLTRPEGWEQRIADELARQAAQREPVDEAGELRREQKRREAAESAAYRARIEVGELKESLAREREAVAQLSARAERAERDAAAAKSHAREVEAMARRRESGARVADAAAGAVAAELEALRVELAAAQAARDAALEVRAGEASAIDVVRLRALLQEAVALTGVAAPKAGRRRTGRTPLAVPGGLHRDADAATEHLLRAPGVLVLVDGYNVAKLGWPDLTLEQQRERCLDVCDDLARRWGTELHVVFDGADVVGAHATRRRLVRVSFSPAGVLADDVLRAQVAALDPTRPVVVVTNDQAVAADVRADGANTVASHSFLAVARR